MATEYPPLGKSYVLSYSNDDKNYPIIAIKKDPRLDNYRRPDDLSPHPEPSRYPNHLFTGTQPTNTDERVIWVYEILPAPWVPFTRYDDDLGPVQGRRRFVTNSGQEATLERDRRVTFEAREGSAIVSTEIEETWDGGSTDPDLESPFPIKDRDFYDPSRGPVQERRQLISTTGNEVATLENKDGVITQTSYEAYNEFLSFKVVQTYSVDGPQLVGQTTDNDGQLVTVTTQRKGVDNYIPPSPTATRTVEVSREDAESLVERVVDTPELFKANTFSLERPDPIPQKFRVAVPLQSSQEIVEGEANPNLVLEDEEISRNEEQRNKFIKRVSVTSRDKTVLPIPLEQKSTDNDRQEVTITETLQEGDTNETATATTTIESEALGDGNYVVRKTEVPELFAGRLIAKESNDPAPPKFRVSVPATTQEAMVAGTVEEPQLNTGDIAKSEQQVNKFVKRLRSTFRSLLDLPDTLTQKTTNDQGQLVVVSETLQTGDTIEVPNAITTVTSEALGDGTYVVTTRQIPSVFAEQTFSAERTDPLPQKFRVAAKTITEQRIVEGTANPNITLDAGQLSKSEQQVTEFVKRISTTERDQAQLPIPLAQRSTDNDRQVVTITQVLQEGDSTEEPSATTTIESEDLGDGNFVVTKSTVPVVFAGESYRKTKEDLTPQKFKAAQEDTVSERTVVGEANSNISLQQGEFSKSEQQINKFVKRVAVTSRAVSTVPDLKEKILTQQGQIGNRILTLEFGEQSFSPSATLIDASVEALGDGRTVKTEVTVPSVFPNRTIRKTKEDLTPQKFRASQSDLIIEENVAGTISTPSQITLGVGEFSKSEEQVTEFVKRTSTNTRNIDVAEDLEEFVLTPQGQLAKRTLILSAQSQFIEPDAKLLDGSIEELGDGRTVKTEVRVDEIFDNKTVSASKPDVLPERFRASVPTETTQETIEQTSVEIPSLEDGDLERSEERVGQFTVRKSTVSRNVSEIPDLDGVDYEESFDVQIPYTEKISTTIPTGSAEAVPLDDTRYLVREYDKDNIETYLEDFLQTYPTTINIDLPRVLKSISVEWDEKTQAGSYNNLPFAAGLLYQFSNTDKGEASTQSSATPLVSLNFEDVWSKNIPATVFIFFLKNPVTESEILLKTGSSKWPTFKPKSHVITGKGIDLRASVSVSASINVQEPKPFIYGGYTDQSQQQDYSRSVTPIIINIPQCLHGPISLDEEKTVTASVSAAAKTAAHGIVTSLSSSDTATITDKAFIKGPSLLLATSPQSIPTTGKYLIDSNVDFFKYGFSIVRATIIDAAVFA